MNIHASLGNTCVMPVAVKDTHPASACMVSQDSRFWRVSSTASRWEYWPQMKNRRMA